MWCALLKSGDEDLLYINALSKKRLLSALSTIGARAGTRTDFDTKPSLSPQVKRKVDAEGNTYYRIDLGGDRRLRADRPRSFYFDGKKVTSILFGKVKNGNKTAKEKHVPLQYSDHHGTYYWNIGIPAKYTIAEGTKLGYSNF